ncbi:GNAT family N-acetyltransferase [Sporosarcina sp. 179-K 8C2 HS]|uniref:GNAT family N-acetyltransferase n=1 Tax=Sporosarcina sp. 179-K 8C2 HS TaxID=3142387 RepID=UPI0039A2BF7A
MEIRKLCPEDAEAYFQIRLEALYTNPEAFGSSYEEEKKQTADKYKERFGPADSFTFGAFDESKLIGVITLLTEKTKKMKHRATIVAMYVTPEKRGKGVAKTLMNEAINKARSLEGIEQVYLTVVNSNVAAKNLYFSLGFEVYGTDKRALKVEHTYLDEDLMVLFLHEQY